MALVVRREQEISFTETASLAAEGFGVPPGSFDPERLRWLYQSAFSDGTAVLSLYDGDRKVGQVALLHQSVRVDDRPETAVALVDLFILKAFRSRKAMTALYGEVERLCRETSVRFILAVPNEKAAKVNARYLSLADFLRLDIRAGVCLPWRGRSVTASAMVDRLERAAAMALFEQILPSTSSGLLWTPDRLWQRLQDKQARYGVHATRNLLMVSSPRLSHRLPHTLICAMLPKPGVRVRRREVMSLVRAACALHGRPVYIYAGVNEDVPLPGVTLPARFRPSVMTVQIRDFAPEPPPVRFNRFESLDFDFA